MLTENPESKWKLKENVSIFLSKFAFLVDFQVEFNF